MMRKLLVVSALLGGFGMATFVQPVAVEAKGSKSKSKSAPRAKTQGVKNYTKKNGTRVNHYNRAKKR